MKEKELLYKLGQRIKTLRDEKSWTLRDLEDYAEIDNSDLSKYESGNVDIRFTTLYKLSQALGVKLTDLVDFE